MNVPPFFQGPATGEWDWTTEFGAKMLAERIEKRWVQAGHYNVRAMARKLPGRIDKKRDYWFVSTNLVAGLPPR